MGLAFRGRCFVISWNVCPGIHSRFGRPDVKWNRAHADQIGLQLRLCMNDSSKRENEGRIHEYLEKKALAPSPSSSRTRQELVFNPINGQLEVTANPSQDAVIATAIADEGFFVAPGGGLHVMFKLLAYECARS